MDKIEKKKKDVKDIIVKGEKLTEMAKAPVKLVVFKHSHKSHPSVARASSRRSWRR